MTVYPGATFAWDSRYSWKISGGLAHSLYGARAALPVRRASDHFGDELPVLHDLVRWGAVIPQAVACVQAAVPNAVHLRAAQAADVPWFHAPAWAEALGRREGNQVVPFDTGHWVMTKQPERFNQVVGDWLEGA